MKQFCQVALLLVVSFTLVTAPAAAQPRGGGGPGGRMGALGRMISTSVILLAMPEVREELKATPEQSAQIDKILQAARDRLFSEIDIFELQNAEGEEREEILEELRVLAAEMAAEAKKSLSETLDATQLARLEELYLQSEGARGLTRPEVVQALGLSDEQVKKINAVFDEADSAPPPARNFRELSDEQRQQLFEEMRARREKTQAEALAVLDEAQQKSWQTMQGAAFEFPRGGGGIGAFFGFGGRGQGGPGQGGPARGGAGQGGPGRGR